MSAIRTWILLLCTASLAVTSADIGAQQMSPAFEVSEPSADVPTAASLVQTAIVPSGSVPLVARHSGKCLTAAGDPSRAVAATQETCTGAPSQQWLLKPVTGGYEIVSVISENLCLNLRAATPAQGARVWRSTCSATGRPGEIWSLQPALAGTHALIASHSEKCLDVSQESTADGAAILQYTCHGSQNEMWAMSTLPAPQAIVPPLASGRTRPIAHVEHDGLSFSIAIDDTDHRFLTVMIPEPSATFSTSSRPSVRLRVVMRSDAVIDGVATPAPPWVGNAGAVDVRYRFSLGQPVAEGDIHSITIWIGDQRYTVYPF